MGANIIGYGFNGGSSPGPIRTGGGGGGAGGVGQNGGVGSLGGQGGIGVSYSISGVSIYYGAGGASAPGSPSQILHPTSFPTMFGLGGPAEEPLVDARPGIIIIRYPT
jgi:hypothetical protein